MFGSAFSIELKPIKNRHVSLYSQVLFFRSKALTLQ